MKYYCVEGFYGRPLSFMRCHIFNYGKNFKIPMMVLSPKLVALGIGAPLHPYFKSIIKWYDIAPLQLSPNSWKLVITLHMFYTSLGYDAPSMPEISYFFSLRKSGKGYFFLVIHIKTQQEKILRGKGEK